MKDKRGVLGLNLVGAVILTLLIIAVAIIATFLVLTSVVPTIATVETTRTATANGASEGRITVNSTLGHLLDTCNVYNDGSLVTATVTNHTGDSLNSANYTLSGCYIKAVAGSEGNILWNVTAYTFGYKKASSEAESIEKNITTGTVNFIKQVPTIMVILGVIVLILAIAIIIVSVRRFGGGAGESFGGSSGESSYQL